MIVFPWLASLSPLMSVRLLPLGELVCLPRSGFNVGANVSPTPVANVSPTPSSPVICWWKPRGSLSDQRLSLCLRLLGESDREDTLDGLG